MSERFEAASGTDIQNGRLYQNYYERKVYWADRGEARHVPSQETYNRLFRPDAAMLSAPIFREMSLSFKVGRPLSLNAFLLRNEINGAIYLVDTPQGQPVKRHITGPPQMDYCQFNGLKAVNAPPRVTDLLPDGEAISYR